MDRENACGCSRRPEPCFGPQPASHYLSGALVGYGTADAVANGLPRGRMMRAQNLVSCPP